MGRPRTRLATLTFSALLVACGGRASHPRAVGTNTLRALHVEPVVRAVVREQHRADEPASHALLIRPEVAAIVERIAAGRAIEGHAIGIGGTHSSTWQAYSDLVDLATPAELTALLEHPSLIVRGYVARHIAYFVPSERRRLRPLLADDTRIAMQAGCMGLNMPMAALVGEALCASAEGRELLREAIEAPRAIGATRVTALQCMATWHDPERRVFALAALEATDLELRVTALRVLQDAASASDALRIARLMEIPDDAQRAVVLRTLGSLQAPQVREVAARWLDDPSDEVANEAARAYAAQFNAEPGVLDRLLAAPRTRDGVIAGLARRGTVETIARIEPFLRSRPEGNWALDRAVSEVFEGYPSGARIAAVRRLLLGDFDDIRARAIDYLREVHAVDAAADVRGFLVPNGPGFKAALRAAMEFEDQDAIPLLLGALPRIERANSETALAVGRVLVVLGATEAIPVMRRASQRLWPWVREKMHRQIDALERGVVPDPDAFETQALGIIRRGSCAVNGRVY